MGTSAVQIEDTRLLLFFLFVFCQFFEDQCGEAQALAWRQTFDMLRIES